MPDSGKNVTTTAKQSREEEPPVHHPRSIERQGYVQGLFLEMNTLLAHYQGLVEQISELQARIMITERNLCLTREHIRMVLGKTDEEVPTDWEDALNKIRFVGARLGDACVQIIQEKETGATLQEIVDLLNLGQYRFRTGTPLREVNAALLRQPNVLKKDDCWLYRGLKAISA